MRVAYADPPYPGQAARYKDHPDYAGEVDHFQLGLTLQDYDGWILHTSTPALPHVIQCLAEAGHRPADPYTGRHTYRIMAWVKTWAAFKPNVPVAYAWEPVLVKACRKPVVSNRLTMRDWIGDRIAMERGLHGAKPDSICYWAFEVAGMEPTDELDDLFPGTRAVTDAWHRWQNQMRLSV